MIRTFRTGAHAHRTPLSSPALRPLFHGHIVQVNHPDDADLLIFGHSLDILNAPLEVVKSWRQHQQPVVLLSEEPFWDTIWGREPGTRDIVLETPYGPLPVIQLNHQTSAVFAFDQIPYYLLTNHRFATAYAARFTRNAALSASDWQQRFETCRQALVFMFERRPEPHHNVSWAEEDIIGLCAWRTDVAEACSPVPGVTHLGHSWAPETPKRQDRLDWHLDKLVDRDGQQRVLAAFENTHQRQYISEKFFDAFACGAQPAYFASPQHGIHRLALPADSWINCYGLSPSDALQQIMTACDTITQTAEDYVIAQKKLAALFTSPDIWLAERERLRRTLLCELNSLLS